MASAWLPHIAGLESVAGAGFDSAVVFGLALVWLLASNAFRYRSPGSRMETLGAELLIVAYAGLLLCLTVRLRWIGLSAARCGRTVARLLRAGIADRGGQMW